MRNKVIFDNNSIRNNSFDLLRLLAAFIVLSSHSFRHFGIDKPSYSLFLTDGSIGVMIFFVISGFCIMPAYERLMASGKSFFHFLVNRFLRLYPCIWMSFLLVSILDIYVLNIDIFSFDFIKYSVEYCVFLIGEGYQNGFSNGVLWSLIPIVFYYLFTPVIFFLSKFLNPILWILLILSFWGLNVFDLQLVNMLYSFFGEVPFIKIYANETFPFCFFL